MFGFYSTFKMHLQSTMNSRFIKRINIFLFVFAIIFIYLFMTVHQNAFTFYGLFNTRPPHVMSNISDIAILDPIDLPCARAFTGDKTAMESLLQFDFNIAYLQHLIHASSNRCDLYQSSFGFSKSPASKEEIDYPLAYAVLAHNRFEQLLLMLASFYESHNVFCISLPMNADHEFARLVRGLADCFDNIHVIPVGKVSWGSYSILSSTYGCMEYFLELPVFQYLSGVDVPLRTNLEMVRILQQWNGLSHTHVTPFQEFRLPENDKRRKPLPLYKSSLSAIISREAAQMMVEHPKARELFEYLRPTFVADESFWASALGNPDVVPIPGAFNASEYLAVKLKAKEPLVKRECSHHPCLNYGFVARYQEWTGAKCKGDWMNGSCVFGVRDLPALAENAAFVAHKLYLDMEPAAFICMLKEIALRRSHPDDRFDAVQYNDLPQIEFARGVSSANLTRADLLISS